MFLKSNPVNPPTPHPDMPIAIRGVGSFNEGEGISLQRFRIEALFRIGVSGFEASGCRVRGCSPVRGPASVVM